MKDPTLFQLEGMKDLVEAVIEVQTFFGDTKKTAAWFVTSNGNFGGARPITFFLLDRGHKVLNFIRAAKDGF